MSQLCTLLLIVLVFFLSGCASTANHYTQTVESWRGGRVCDLMARWGSPYKQIVGNNGSRVLVYKTRSYVKTPERVTGRVNVSMGDQDSPLINPMPNTNTTWSRGVSYSCIAAFKVNRQAMIVGTQTEGTGCYGSVNFAKSMGNPRVVNLKG